MSSNSKQRTDKQRNRKTTIAPGESGPAYQLQPIGGPSTSRSASKPAREIPPETMDEITAYHRGEREEMPNISEQRMPTIARGAINEYLAIEKKKGPQRAEDHLMYETGGLENRSSQSTESFEIGRAAQQNVALKKIVGRQPTAGTNQGNVAEISQALMTTTGTPGASNQVVVGPTGTDVEGSQARKRGHIPGCDCCSVM